MSHDPSHRVRGQPNSRTSATTPASADVRHLRNGLATMTYYSRMSSRTRGTSHTVAHTWEDALVVGNGTVGAMLFGSPGEEQLVINRAGLFLPTHPPLEPPDLASRLDAVRGHAIAGRFPEVAIDGMDAGRAVGIDGLIWTDPFVPAAYLFLQHGFGLTASDYVRETDLGTGDASIEYRDAGSALRIGLSAFTDDHSCRLCISRAAGLDGLSLRLGVPELSSGEQEVVNRYVSGLTTTATPECLSLHAEFVEDWPGSLSGYRVACKVQSGSSKIAASGSDTLTIRGGRELIVDISVALEARSEGPRGVQSGMRGNGREEITARLQREIAGRCRLDLSGEPDAPGTIEDLREEFRNPKARNVLFEKIFAAGRMRVLQATGELPPTLSGIWGGSWAPQWSGDFTANGNLQTAIEGMLPLGMHELLLPYFSYLESLLPDFRKNASRLYGARGIYVPSRMSSHGLMNHYNETYAHIFWIGGAAWAAHFYYDYFRYTRDKRFLRERALPFMVEAAAFYTSLLGPLEDPLVIAPSYSPENSPANVSGDVQVTRNAVMDIDLIRELLTNAINAHRLLETAHEDLPQWERLRSRLPAYHINNDGAVSEWSDSGLDDSYQHRHASHLYRLFYERPVVLDLEPSLETAFAVALERRMEHRRSEQAGTMAFGLVQLGHAAISLRDAESTEQILLWLADGYWSNALTSTHDRGSIFNTDICGGLPNLMARAIIDGSGHRIDVLPALPAMWPEGRLTGVRLRGGWKANVEWANGRLASLSLTSGTENLDDETSVRYAGSEVRLSAGANEQIVFDGKLQRR